MTLVVVGLVTVLVMWALYPIFVEWEYRRIRRRFERDFPDLCFVCSLGRYIREDVFPHQCKERRS